MKIPRQAYNFYVGLLLALIPLVTILLFMNQEGRPSPSGLDMESLLARRLVELKDQMRHIEMLSYDKKVQINELKHQISLVGRLVENQTKDHNQHGTLFQEEVPNILQVPTLHHFLPHLLDHRDPLNPALRITSQENQRRAVHMVFGIPTVKRPLEMYLENTLNNIIENLSPEERLEVLIVVMIAETDKVIVDEIAEGVKSEFMEHIQSGLLEIISPPPEYYPDFNKTLKITLGDPIERVKWRTKQNLDYAYLMMYCQPRGTYYVQLEDDILSKRSYYAKMKEYAQAKTLEKPDWFLLDFCSLGFIGKMFKSIDLSSLVIFFVMFRNDKPVDWLLENLIQTRICPIDVDPTACKKLKNTVWIGRRPSLFQHIGIHSSLKGKVQKLKDRGFGRLSLFYPHKDNPPASVSTTLSVYKVHNLRNAYDGHTFFWAMTPKAGDALIFEFGETGPEIEYYLFRSGNPEHPGDKMLNTSVQIKPAHELPQNITDSLPSLFGPTSYDSAQSISPISFKNSPMYEKTKDGYYTIGSFRPTGVAEGRIPREFGPITSLRLYINTPLPNWVILSEIQLKTRKPS